METPTLFFSSGDPGQTEGPVDDFQRLAASGYLESVGYRVGDPPWEALFGHGVFGGAGSLAE